MAEAVVEERHLIKSLRWWDGFTIAMCNPGFLFASLGFTMGVFGVLGSVIMWGLSAIIGMVLTWIYVEPASMFPNKSGGISLYANEAWRKYTTLVGPIATFGYWIGWSVVLAIFGKIIGDLVQARWFPNTTFTVWDGVVHLSLSSFIAIGVIIAVWAFNIFGVRPMKGLTYITAGLLSLVLIVFMFVPYISGDWHSSNVAARDLHGTVGRDEAGVRLAVHPRLVVLGVRGVRHVCPRVQDRARHAHRVAQLGYLRRRRIHPGAARAGRRDRRPVGRHRRGPVLHSGVREDRGTHRRDVLSDLPDRQPRAVDGGFDRRRQPRAVRDLQGGSDDQAARHAQPVPRAGLGDDGRPGRQRRASAVHHKQPGDPLHEQHRLRPRARAGGQRLPAAAKGPSELAETRQARAGLDSNRLVHDDLRRVPTDHKHQLPHLNGYGTWTDFAIGVGVLAASVLLFIFRRVVQDGEKIHFREETPTMPEEGEWPSGFEADVPVAHATT